MSVPKSEQALDDLIAANDTEFDVFKQQLLQQWKFILHHSLSTPSPQLNAGDAPLSLTNPAVLEPASIERLAARAEVVPAKPLLFTDLHMRDLSTPLEEIANSLNMDPDSTSLREMLAATSIPSLISSVPNQAISKMSRTLKDMSAAMMLASSPTSSLSLPSLPSTDSMDENTTAMRKTVMVKRHAEPPALLSRCKLVDQHANAFGVSMASWKQDTTTTLKQLEVALGSIASRSVDAARQQLGLLAVGYHRGVRHDALTFIRESSVRPLVDSAASLWRSLAESIPQAIELRLQLINTMLQECSGLIEMRFALDINGDQPRRLQEFCKSIQETALKQMSQFRDTIAVLDPLAIIKDATMRVLQQHLLPEKSDDVSPAGSTFELRNVVEFPISAVAAIVAKIVHVVTVAQQHLDAMQRDVMMALRSVVIAVRSTGAPASSSIVDQVSQFNSYDPMEGIQKTVAAAAVVQPHSGLPTLPPSAISAAASVTVASNKPWMVISGMHSVVSQSHASLLFDGSRWDRLDLTAKAQARVNFDKQLQQSGLKVLDIVGDAASQFRALSHQVYSAVETHAVIRMLICSEILNHPHYYERMISHTRGVDLQEYVQIMALDSCRGDHVSLCAFSNLFGADLMLYSPAFQHPVHIQARTRHILSNGEHRVFSVALLPDDRYASLVPLSKLNSSHSALPSSAMPSRTKSGNDFGDSDNDEDFSTDSTHSRSYSTSRRRKRSDSDESLSSSSRPSTKSSPGAVPGASKRTKVDPAAKLQPSSSNTLLQKCISSIVENIDLYPPLEGAAPDELLTKILAGLCAAKRLTDDTFTRVLDGAMRSIAVEVPTPALTDASLFSIAKKCGRRLRSIKLIGCVGITNRGLISLAESCSELESISLRGCVAISNMAIQELARRCRNLFQIDLSGCTQVTDIAVQELALACPNIRMLFLQSCPQLGDNAFTYFPKTLQVLDIFESEQITDKTVVSVARRSGASLEILRASGRNLSDAGVEEIARQCPKLRTLEIANGDHLTEASISQVLFLCSSLRILSLPGCRGLGDVAFNSSCMDRPPFPAELESLNLSLCFKLTDATLRAIARSCKSIRTLSLAGCEEVTDEAFVELAMSNRQLRNLDVSKCGKLTSVSIKALADACYTLQRVTLADCKLITTDGVVELASKCKKLVDVDLSGCENILDQALERLAANQKLRSINLSDCSKLTSAGVSHLAICSRLQRLRLAGCKSLSDATLTQLSRSCSALVDLDLSHCTTVSLRALQAALPFWQQLTRLNLRGIAFAQAPEGSLDARMDAMDTDSQSSVLRIEHYSLEDLNISWCKMVDDEVVGILAQGCPSLVSLDVAWCSQITANAIHQLTQHCPNLRTLNLRGCTRVGMLNYLNDNPLVIYR